MTIFCRIELLGPPRGMGRPRMSRRPFPHVHQSDTDMEYQGNLLAAAKEAMRGQPPSPKGAPLRVVVTAYCPIPASMPKRVRAVIPGGGVRPTGKPDADNIAKMLDSLNKIVWNDDAQIVELQVAKFYDERPRLVVAVTEL